MIIKSHIEQSQKNQQEKYFFEAKMNTFLVQISVTTAFFDVLKNNNDNIKKQYETAIERFFKQLYTKFQKLYQ